MVPHAPPAVSPSPVLKPDWETLARLASRRSKPPDLDPCPMLSSLRGFCGTTDKPKPAWFSGPNQETVAVILRSNSPNWSCQFWGSNRETRSHRFWGQTGRNRRHRFWGQTGENHPSGFEVKPLTNHRPWFWGSTKKPALFVSMCTVHTAHSATRPLDHPATEYLTCATFPSPLHQVSDSHHNPRCCTPCHTCHLHTTRQAKRDSPMKQRIKVKQPKCPRFKFKPRQVNDSSESNQGTDYLVAHTLNRVLCCSIWWSWTK
jgi:hypothetical protein